MFFKQKTAYDMRISDWSSDVCSSDLRLSAYELSVALRREFKGHLIHQPDKVLNGAVHACVDDPCRNPDSAICFLDCISGMGKSLEGCIHRHVSIPALFSDLDFHRALQ